MKNLITKIALIVLVSALSATRALPDTQPATIQTVSIHNFAFSPAYLTVNAGDTVKFVNQDDETHTVSATEGAYDSGPLNQNATFSYTFTKAGVYHYYCRIHTAMKGTIVVNAGR
jgi:plastocyanin